MSMPCALLITSTTILEKRDNCSIALEWKCMKRMHFADYNEMLIIEIGPLE